MAHRKQSIGQVLVPFTCNNCGQKTAPFSFEVFEDADGKADLILLAADVNCLPLLCDCGNTSFSADIKIGNYVLNHQAKKI